MQIALVSPCRIKRKRHRWRQSASGRRDYNYFRDYDTGSGRYVQSDPVGLNGGNNTYRYANANALSWKDADGLQASRAVILPTGPAGISNPYGPASSVSGSDDGYGGSGRDVGRVLRDGTALECDRCEPIYAEIRFWLAEVKQRFTDLREDKRDLYNTRPIGKFSWRGHQDQFRSKQRTLRSALVEADGLGCFGYPSDAWSWASAVTPVSPR